MIREFEALNCGDREGTSGDSKTDCSLVLRKLSDEPRKQETKHGGDDRWLWVNIPVSYMTTPT